jgi:TctA family transporter
MNYPILFISLLIGIIFSWYALRKVKKPTDIVWIIIITFFIINILIVILDRYILPGHYIMDLIKNSVPWILTGIYIYLIMLVLGIFNGPKNKSNTKNI